MSKETAKDPKKKKSFNKKKLKYGSVATIITVIFIAVIVFINLIAGILTERKGLKLDLTPEKYYDISQQTIDYVSSIDKDVEIAVFDNESNYHSNTYYKMVLETLNKLVQYSDHITYNFYDTTKNPDAVNKYAANYNGTISMDNIVIASGDRVKVLSVSQELFAYTTNSYYGTSALSGYKGEQELLSAIMSVTDANPKTAAFITKYNGSAIFGSETVSAITTFAELMTKNGYELVFTDIIADEISPEDYDLVVLPAPATDIPEDSIKKLEDFLYNGGNLDKNLIYIADTSQRKTPNIDEFLEIWGIEVGGNQVIESEDKMTQQVNVVRNTMDMNQALKAPIVTASDETFSEGLSNTKLPIIAPMTRNINLLFDANVDRTTTALLSSSESSLLYPLNLTEADDSSQLDLNGESSESEDTTQATEETEEFDASNAEKGSNVVMALATKSNTDSEKVTHTNNMLVIGGASMIDTRLTTGSTYNNAEFIMNAVNKICGKENSVIIAEKNLGSETIDITVSQAAAIRRVVMFVIPIIVVICGVVVFIRRRNR